MSLNESYPVVRGHFLLIELLPSVNCAYTLVLQEGRQCNIRAPPIVEGIALDAKGNLPPRKESKSSFPKKMNDQNALIAVVKVIPPSGVTIFTDSLLPVIKLTLTLHLVRTLALNPFLTKFSLPSVLSLPDQFQQLLAILNNATPQQSKCVFNLVWSLWILDSSGTDHMVYFPTTLAYSYHVHSHTLQYGIFSYYLGFSYHVHSHTVQLPNDSYAFVTHIQSMIFFSSYPLT